MRNLTDGEREIRREIEADARAIGEADEMTEADRADFVRAYEARLWDERIAADEYEAANVAGYLAMAAAEDAIRAAEEAAGDVPYGVVAYEYRMAGEAVADGRAEWLYLDDDDRADDGDEFPW